MAININVTTTKVTIQNKSTIILNKGEYNINTCTFSFSSEYDNLEKRAIFYSIMGNKYITEIKDNSCIIPYEILGLSGTLVIGVFAYRNNADNTLDLRYSPQPDNITVLDGSYSSGAKTSVAAYEYKDFISEANILLNEIQTKLDNEEFNGVGIELIRFNPDYTFTIFLTDGTSYTSPNLKGDPGEPGQNGTNGIDGRDGVDGKDAKINGVNILTIEAGSNINLEQEGNTLTISSTGGGTSNYQDLTNKPSINNITLTGNKSLNDLGIQAAGNYLTSETDPTVPSYVKNITQENINNWNNKSDFSGDYNDLSNKPTIPAEVTESTVSNWGFTKNTGTYSKPQNGIPKTDLESAVQTSLGKADTALQSYTEQYTGTITGITMNGVSKGTSGVVDLGTVITQHQDISGKLDTSKVKNVQSTTAGDVYDVRYINSMIGNIETLLQEV